MRVAFLFLFAFSVLAAQTRFDSLISQIKTLPDTTKARMLLDFCWNNRSRTPHQSLNSGESALKIAQSLKDFKLQAKAYNLIGVVYRNLGKYERAIASYKNALRIAESSGDSTQIAYSCNNIGGLYRLEGNNTIALEYILRGLKIFENHHDKAGMAFCTINIGLIYRRQQNYIKALEYLDYTLKLRDEINDLPGKALALNLIAEIHYEQGNINDALNYFFEVEKEYTAVDDKKGLAATWSGIGDIYYDKKDYTNALLYRTKALEMSKKINYMEGLINNYCSIGLIYARLGQFAKGSEFMNEARKTVPGFKEVYSQMELDKYLAEFYEIKKDYSLAMTHLKKYQVLKDSVNKLDNIAMVTEMEAVHKAEKAERENAILTKDIEAEREQRNNWIVIALLVIVIAIITYNRYHSKKIAHEKLQELNALKDKFFSIIAHDLKNPFSVIFAYTETLLNQYNELDEKVKLKLLNDIDKTSKQTYRLLENLLYWSQTQTGKMEFHPDNFDLFELIKQTFSLVEGAAKNKNIELTTNVADAVEVYGDEQMIKLILRNLVTNGIKFTSNGGRVSVLLNGSDGTNEICIEDTGIGISEEKLGKLFKIENVTKSEGTAGEKGTGLGLVLCKEFVERHGGKISVESEVGKGSKFILTLPSKI